MFLANRTQDTMTLNCSFILIALSSVWRTNHCHESNFQHPGSLGSNPKRPFEYLPFPKRVHQTWYSLLISWRIHWKGSVSFCSKSRKAFQARVFVGFAFQFTGSLLLSVIVSGVVGGSNKSKGHRYFLLL